MIKVTYIDSKTEQFEADRFDASKDGLICLYDGKSKAVAMLNVSQIRSVAKIDP